MYNSYIICSKVDLGEIIIEILEFKNTILDLLRCISENMENVFEKMYEKYGLTIMQVRILFEIDQNDEKTIGRLGKSTGITSGNMSVMCKKIEKMGLIKRIRDIEDERVVKVVLTEKGKETIKEINDTLSDKYLICFKEESKESLENIIKELKNLNSLLDKMKNY